MDSVIGLGTIPCEIFSSVFSGVELIGEALTLERTREARGTTVGDAEE